MNLRINYLIGKTYQVALDTVLSSPLFPRTRVIPKSTSLGFDLRRFAGNEGIKVVLDVGANCGDTVAYYRKYFRDAQIYAFEPVSKVFSELEQRFASDSNVKCFNLACGDSEGNADIFFSDSTELSTLRPKGEDSSASYPSSETVLIRKLDLFCEEMELSQVDYLKIDTEGFEVEVLQGAKNLLSTGRIRFILVETSLTKNEQHTYLPKIEDLLSKHEYRMVGLYDTFHWGPSKMFMGFTNALFVSAKETAT